MDHSPTSTSPTREAKDFLRLLKDLLNLRADTDKEGTVELIESNIDFRSANAWTLVFAIFIASVGLNVNSTAAVIGAMLISPLMGPIVGSGYALGTYNFPLLKKCTKNLAAAVIISVVTSTVYFLISPLTDVQSELLARTRPSFFDVLIAFFGGAAGIIAISRKERGNAIPGVAIATALMPPLCTAGYGLATRHWSYFFGAIYLFAINGVFISISTLIFVRYLKFHEAKTVALQQQAYVNRWITYVGVAVLIPSFFMAWYLQQESLFRSQANKFISQELGSNTMFIVDREISYSLKRPKVKVSLLGDPLSMERIALLKSKASNYSIPPEAIEILQSTFSENLEKRIGEKISAAEGHSSQLQLQVKKYELELTEIKSLSLLEKKIVGELDTFLPGKVSGIYLTKTAPSEGAAPTEAPPQTDLNAVVQWHRYPTGTEKKRAGEFLIQRLGAKQINHVKEF